MGGLSISFIFNIASKRVVTTSMTIKHISTISITSKHIYIATIANKHEFRN